MAAAKVRRCVDCIPGSVRKAPHPGPRCASHHRAVLEARKARARARRRVKVFGLADGDYERLQAFQGGRCAICQVATGKARALAVDHEHTTGLVRGLLCKPCNFVLLGRYDTAALQRALDYLEHPPAEKIGLVAYHVDVRSGVVGGSP